MFGSYEQSVEIINRFIYNITVSDEEGGSQDTRSKLDVLDKLRTVIINAMREEEEAMSKFYEEHAEELNTILTGGKYEQ